MYLNVYICLFSLWFSKVALSVTIKVLFLCQLSPECGLC